MSTRAFHVDPEISLPLEDLFLGSACPSPAGHSVLLRAALRCLHFSPVSNRRPECFGFESRGRGGESRGGLFLCPGVPRLAGKFSLSSVVFSGLILVFVGRGAASLASPAADPPHPTGLPPSLS